MILRWVKKWLNFKDMYIVEYKMKSDIDSKQFAYETFGELYERGDLEFINEAMGQVLTLRKEDLSYYITRPYMTNEN